MKQDMDLIRKILLKVENEPSGGIVDFSAIESSKDKLDFHLRQLMTAGFLESTNSINGNTGLWAIYGDSLTFEGSEFAAVINNDSLFEKAKDAIKNNAVGFSLILFKELSMDFARKKLGL